MSPLKLGRNLQSTFQESSPGQYVHSNQFDPADDIDAYNDEEEENYCNNSSTLGHDQIL